MTSQENQRSRILQVEQLVKCYLSGSAILTIIDKLDLIVRSGEKIAITGPSGCGKTTLLNLIGGMDEADSGRILFQGENLSCKQPKELARFRNEEIGFVFQFHHLLPEFSSVENVMMPLLLRRQSSAKAQMVASALLKQLGLGDRLYHRPGELSGGEQQRVALARSLVGEPRLLLADEPTGNLDTKTSHDIHLLLVKVHETFNLTSIIVTHDPHLSSLCDQVWNLDSGRLDRVA